MPRKHRLSSLLLGAQVFMSMITVGLLALIALTSYTIVNRQKAVERCAS